MNAISYDGFALAALAAVIGGSTLAPMKFQRGWRFENTWLIYSLCAYLVAPWAVAAVTVPHLLSVYAASGAKTISLTALFGFGWGLAVVLNGYVVTVLGLALTTGILMGSSIAIGSLLPVLLVNPQKLGEPGGLILIAANGGLMCGVLLCTWAGVLREKKLTTSGGVRAAGTRNAIWLCLLAGLLSTMLNVALTNGAGIAKSAEDAGAASFHAANAVWAIAVSAGSLPSILWCCLRLSREGAWAIFAKQTQRNAGLCVLMGVIWISSTVLYGAAARIMGPVGPAVGWPIYMAGIVLTGAAWGWATGEWRGARGKPANLMIAGILLQVVFMCVIGGVR